MPDTCTPIFTFVSSVGWKMFPDQVGDAPYLMENLEDYDPNEDHVCGGCGGATTGRFLNCCQHCHIEEEKMMDAYFDQESNK